MSVRSNMGPWVALLLGGVGVACGGLPEPMPITTIPEEAPVDVGSTKAPTTAKDLSPRSYQTTASVGDFLELTFHPATSTASYKNRTNGFSSPSVPYTVDASGIAVFADPNDHLQRAIELPGHSVVVELDHAGADRSERALAFGALTKPFAASDVSTGQYLQMQFRTRGGGVEFGTVSLATTSKTVSAQHTGYWPRGAAVGSRSALVSGSPIELAFPDASTPKNFVSAKQTRDGVSETTFLFRTAEAFAFDLPGGTMLTFPTKATPAFETTFAGTYDVLTYEKTSAQGSVDDEPGLVDVVRETIVVTVDGRVTLVNAGVAGTLAPASDTLSLGLDPDASAGLYRAGGLGTSGQRELFVTFTEAGLGGIL